MKMTTDIVDVVAMMKTATSKSQRIYMPSPHYHPQFISCCSPFWIYFSLSLSLSIDISTVTPHLLASPQLALFYQLDLPTEQCSASWTMFGLYKNILDDTRIIITLLTNHKKRRDTIYSFIVRPSQQRTHTHKKRRNSTTNKRQNVMDGE